MQLIPFIARPGPVLKGPTLTLRVPRLNDYEEWAALRRESRAFLEPWEPRWGREELERGAWRERFRRYRKELDEGSGLPFFLIENQTGALVGGITVGNIRHGVSQSAHIGYWMGMRYAGRGMMVEAVGLTVGYCFSSLRLHRLEAACIPGNKRSIRVLEKAGFTREGLLRSYLRINGTWQDHYLYALIVGERQEPSRGRSG